MSGVETITALAALAGAGAQLSQPGPQAQMLTPSGGPRPFPQAQMAPLSDNPSLLPVRPPEAPQMPQGNQSDLMSILKMFSGGM